MNYLLSLNFTALFSLLTTSLISVLVTGCGGEASKNASTEALYLHQPQATFTIPSRLEINSDDGNVYCSEVLLEYPDKNIEIDVSSAWYPALNKVFCALDNFPADIGNATRLNIRKSYYDSEASLDRQFENPGKKLNGATNPQAVNLQASSTALDKFIPIATPEGKYVLPQIDTSGAATSLMYILNTKYGYSYNEQEVFELLLEAGEIDAIINRRGFSLLDVNRSYEYLGITTGGFSVPTDTPFDASDIFLFQENLPFFSFLNIFERPSHVAITDISFDGVTVLHPNLGYVYISMKDFREGDFLDDDSWIVVLNDF